MSKKSGLQKIMNVAIWLTGIIVALAVGFAMLPGGALSGNIPYIPEIITTIAAWIVIIATIIGVISAIIKALS